MRYFKPGPEARLRGFGWRMPFPPPWAGPHGPAGPFGPGHHGHGRARGGRGGRRANVRAAILALLLERPMHGYEMISELDNRTGGAWRPSPGSVYPTLQLLEDEGLIASEEAGGRRRFTLTDAGRAEAEQVTGEPPWAEFADADAMASWHDVKQATFGAMDALRQVVMTGTEEQRARAVDVINEARRKLYAILAD